MNKTRVWTAFKKGVNALMNNPGCLRKILNMSMLSGFFDKRKKTIKRYDGETVSGEAKNWGQVNKGKDKKMKEYLIPPIDEHKKRTLSYNEIEFLIKRITDVVNKSPDGKKLEEEIEKAKRMFSITSVMSLVRGGTFKMGDEYIDRLHRKSYARPVHPVKLTYDYYMGKYEVTFNEYDIYCENTGKSNPDDRGWGREKRPVILVSWYEAILYCNWLSEKEDFAKAYDSNGNLLDKNGRKTTDITQVEGYRLPTEAEWEYAASGGHKSIKYYKYAGSDNPDDVAWYWKNSDEKTHEVGQKAPNELGLYDMSGNVWEWCHDWYDSDYYKLSPGENPVGPVSASYRVVRGGSWIYGITRCRVTNRYYFHLGQDNPRNIYQKRGYYHVGFRTARTRLVSSPQEEYMLKIKPFPPGGGKVTGCDYYEAGESVNIIATANKRYQFVNWMKNGIEISTQTDETYEMPAENVILVANFKEKYIPVPITEMVLVHPESFQMGNIMDDSEGSSNEKPVHNVKLTYDYYIGKTEVTFNAYDAYCENTRKSNPDDRRWGRGKRPVINVSWWDAVMYCNYLSEQEGLEQAYDNEGNLLDKYGKPTTDITKVEGYRLPTEAEWEYAARGGHKSTCDYKYAGSNNLKEVGWYWQNSGDKILGGEDNDWDRGTIRTNNSKTHEVGQKAPNELGLYDMSGNVWEWCHDAYDPDYYKKSPIENPVNDYHGANRVRRGGSLFDMTRRCRVAYRSGFYNSYSRLGFRIARTRK